MTDAAKRSQTNPIIVYLSGAPYECAPGETVLDALLRQKPDLAYSCKKGTCLSCILKTDGPVPAEAQVSLRPTLAEQGYFLPCLCPPADGMLIEPAEGDGLFSEATIESVDELAPHITRVRLRPNEAFEYQAGQFINLRRDDGLTRSYSLASVPGQDDLLELHIKRLENGVMSNWAADGASASDAVEIQGPNGSCFYLEGDADSPLMMIGNGAGLAPIWAIARDALGRGHQGGTCIMAAAMLMVGICRMNWPLLRHDTPISTTIPVFRGRSPKKTADAGAQKMSPLATTRISRTGTCISAVIRRWSRPRARPHS